SRRPRSGASRGCSGAARPSTPPLLGLRELESPVRPFLDPVRIGERDHVSGVAGEEVLPAIACTVECGLEQRDRRCGVATRAEFAAPLQIDPHPRNRLVTCEALRLPKQALAGAEVP